MTEAIARRVAALVVALAVILVAGFAAFYFLGVAGNGAAKAKQVKLVIVTRLSPEEQQELKKAFLNTSVAKKYGIVDIEFRKVSYAQWRQLAESGKVDGFVIGEKLVYDQLCRVGAFAPLQDEKLLGIVNELPESLKGMRDGKVCWVAIGQAVYGFIVNKAFLEQHGLPEPDKWGSLLDPVYLVPLTEGAYTVSWPRPSMSGTSRTTLHGILQRYGWEKGWQVLTAIGVEASIVDSSERARDEAAEGLVAVAPAYIGYGIEAEEMSKGAAVFKIPRGEGILYISPAAVAAKAPHREAMEAFIAWLLSDEGQRTLARLYYYIPVRPVSGIEWVERIYNELKGNIFSYNRSLAERIDRAVVVYYEAAIADPDVNAVLKQVGRRLAELLKAGKLSKEDALRIIEELGKPLTIRDPWGGGETVFTIEYAEKVNPRLADAKDRQAFYNAVKEAALERYQSILAQLEAYGG
jgi:ABC-type Fe3+ transport system substrate-binding protein